MDLFLWEKVVAATIKVAERIRKAERMNLWEQEVRVGGAGGGVLMRRRAEVRDVEGGRR